MNPATIFICRTCLLPLSLSLLTISATLGQSPPPAQPAQPAKAEPAPAIRAGHSMHGEAFNEGPRSAAYLMAGMGKVDFPITTASPMAQRFFNQGIAQLHGFWYFEAERSFRQASAIDPACAMNYWGMALANTNNRGRAQKLIEEAKKRRSQASPREARYIDALVRYLDDESSKDEKSRRKPQQRAKDYLRDLEEISLEFPNEVEAKAMIALKLWESEREEVPISSHLAIDALLDDIFRANPMHPAHHYRIHLWDGRRPARALDSAGKAGPSSPGIAHMWHMPGHTYSRLHRYHDAAYQQEASARVDHAHMIRDRILPDQIHNFAHNNEWLIGNLIFIGRVNDALSLAKNMISLPRHPKYNNLGGGGSSGNGRRRLFNTLDEYRLWNQALELKDTIYLENDNSFDEPLRNLRLLAVARVHSGKVAEADADLETLQQMRQPREIEFQQLSEEPPAPAAWDATQDWQKKLKEDSEKKRQQQTNRKSVVEQERNKIDQAISLIQAHKKSIINDFAGALEQLRKAGDYNRLQEYEWMLAAGNRDEAVQKIESHVKDHPGEILPLAVAVWLYYQAGNKDKAKEHFEALRTLAHAANLDTPMLARLTPIAEEFGFGKSWAKPYQPAPDIGERPALDLLGPMQWTPYASPEWMIQTSSGEVLSSKQMLGKPVVILFYLGFGCLHCVEQLQKFEPKLAEFQKAGIEVIAISTESLTSLQQGISNLEKPLQLKLNSDPQLRTFQAFRCFDDFEQLPLHGTFAISPEGKVLWQDIGHEPFMDPDFVLREFQRQLKIQR